MEKLPFGRGKAMIQHSDADVNNGSVQATLLIRKYCASGQLELGKAFRQGMKDLLPAWIMRLSDTGWLGESYGNYRGRN